MSAETLARCVRRPLDAPHPGRAHRLYFAVTNDCNRRCPFCSVGSRPGLTTYLPLGTFESLLPREGIFEVQLEGGEPLLHPDLLAMARAARATGRCARVVLSTNGVLLPDEEAPLATALAAFGAPFTLKLSLNHHLLETDPRHLSRALAAARVVTRWRAEGTDVALVLNLRRRRGGDEDRPLLARVEALGLMPFANDFFLQRYGLARDDERLLPPHLAGTDFTLVNPDGSTHGTDLVRRSDAMRRLP